MQAKEANLIREKLRTALVLGDKVAPTSGGLFFDMKTINNVVKKEMRDGGAPLDLATAFREAADAVAKGADEPDKEFAADFKRLVEEAAILKVNGRIFNHKFDSLSCTIRSGEDTGQRVPSWNG